MYELNEKQTHTKYYSEHSNGLELVWYIASVWAFFPPFHLPSIILIIIILTAKRSEIYENTSNEHKKRKKEITLYNNLVCVHLIGSKQCVIWKGAVLPVDLPFLPLPLSLWLTLSAARERERERELYLLYVSTTSVRHRTQTLNIFVG